jgi:hypothetical protein
MESTESRPIDVFDYDFYNDSLFFSYKGGAKYESSIDLGDIILDFGEDGFPIGAEILNASELFNVTKSALKNIIKFGAEFSISEKDIKVTFNISVLLRNQQVERVAASQGVNDINIPAAQIAMAC